MYRLKAFKHTVKRIVAPTGKTHTGNQLPSCRPQASRTQTPLLPRATAGRAAAPKRLHEGVEEGPGDPLLNHPQPISMCETGVPLTRGAQHKWRL